MMLRPYAARTPAFVLPRGCGRRTGVGKECCCEDGTELVEKTWGKYRRIVVTRWLCFERERVEWVN